MAFDDKTRIRLQNFVSEARNLLTEEFTRQLQNEYGLDPTTGEVSDIDSLAFLDDARRQTARLLRDILNHYQASNPSSEIRESLERIVREQAFTVLNRLCALRMAEARDILIESISNGYNSKGFQLYARVAGTALGETGDAYRNYLFSIFDEFAMDLPVLFDRYSPMGRLFPRESVLLELLEKINNIEINPLWTEDETIGWMYQYFNSAEERRQMRNESQAPRNSRELAVRNQFFTPRYVVEFLTDNTLGRIWYEMTKGNTALKDTCRYLVRRPNEIFLARGEDAPEQEEVTEDLSQQELLSQPVYIPFRPLKDPREIRMLDPACGSMHFGLYAFDLFEQIYKEAWELESRLGDDLFERSGEFKPLIESYEGQETFLRDIPRLIIEHNIHGVDIDPRAVQIAGLSLWLRAQRSWKDQNIKQLDRPQIRKSNIVCAESMPGEKDLLQDFTKSLKPRVLGQLVEIIFEKMELAGEAGSLLKIEEEIEEAIEKAREEFNRELLQRKQKGQKILFPELEKPEQVSLFDFTDLPDKTEFWRTAEKQILGALHDYAKQIETGTDPCRRLFAEDAVKGFGFIDLCRNRFDVVLMNPPFGAPSAASKDYIFMNFPDSKHDLYCCFIERGLRMSSINGLLGGITNRTGFFLTGSEKWRRKLLGETGTLCVLADLGDGVLDSALVETAAYCVRKSQAEESCAFLRVIEPLRENKGTVLLEMIKRHEIINVGIDLIRCLPGQPFAYWIGNEGAALFKSYVTLESVGYSCKQGIITADDTRFLRLRWEVDNRTLAWSTLVKGGEYRLFYSSPNLLVLSENDFHEIDINANRKYPYLKGNAAKMLHLDSNLFQKPGIFYTRRTSSEFSSRVLPQYTVYSDKGPAIQLESAKNSKYSLNELLAITNSNAFRSLMSVGLGAAGAAARSYETGLIMKIPIPTMLPDNKNELENGIKKCIKFQTQISSHIETDSWHTSPFGSAKLIETLCINELSDKITNFRRNCIEQIKKTFNRLNKIIWDSYGIPESERNTVSTAIKNHDLSQKIMLPKSRVLPIAIDIVSYLIGAIFGRWDIRYATGKQNAPELPNPYAPLPVCSPGMFQNTEGLPANPNDVPIDYPLSISWSGIIVDDEGHQDDIVDRIRDAIETIWKHKAGETEQESCEILGVNLLREYFDKPNKFFADHLKRYSKSRRQAPIYWPLSTPSSSYTLWIYYHRLTDQILYTCIIDFVEPKIKQISETAANLRQKTSRNHQEEKELEKLTDFEAELKDFRDELLRIAKFWKPDLNDGVQITAAPLWKLFQHKPWQKKLKQTWEKMKKGDYDWAHLAYSIWPDRVIRASHKDHSYAIAHDLESDLWEEIENGTDRQGNPKYKWVSKDLNKQDLKTIIMEKSKGKT